MRKKDFSFFPSFSFIEISIQQPNQKQKDAIPSVKKADVGTEKEKKSEKKML